MKTFTIKLNCLNCMNEFDAVYHRRPPRHCGDPCRVEYNRRIRKNLMVKSRQRAREFHLLAQGVCPLCRMLMGSEYHRFCSYYVSLHPEVVKENDDIEKIRKQASQGGTIFEISMNLGITEDFVERFW